MNPPRFLLTSGSEITEVTLVQGNQRITIKATDAWRAFAERSTTVQCIRCYDHGGQCTRNYAAGCRGNR